MDNWCAVKYCRRSTHTRGFCEKHHYHYRTINTDPDPVDPRQLYRLTPKQLDTRALAFAALIETPDASDRTIAQQVGCNAGTVYNYRRLIGLVNPRRTKDRRPREGIATIPHDEFWAQVAAQMTQDVTTRTSGRVAGRPVDGLGQHRNEKNRKWSKRQGPPR